MIQHLKAMSTTEQDTSKLDDHGRGFLVEAGKFYVDGAGDVYGPMRWQGGEYPWVGKSKDLGNEWSFKRDGKHCEQGVCSCHLIAPWIDWKAEMLACLGHLSERDWFKDPDFHNKHVVCSLDADKVRTAVNAALASLKGEGAGA